MMDSEPSVAMPKTTSPLQGYNTNARYKGRVFHIQTEDSGTARPHVMTHLFADGGRIVASRKTGYAQYLGMPGYRDTVKKLMQEQHKAMFMALRDGQYDDQLDASQGEDAALNCPAPLAEPIDEVPTKECEPPLDARVSGPKFREHVGAAASASTARGISEIPFRSYKTRPLSEQSLDEVILGYLEEELDEEEP
ncbi:MAG: hypothetical protein H6714_02795 [Myxococcales bacterium]|nr:hypothetical protein [Myxococcales bacterium]